MKQLYPYSHIPLLRICLFFIPGIALGKYYYNDKNYPLSLCLFVLIVWYVLYQKLKHRKQFLPESGILILVSSFFLSWLLSANWHFQRAFLKNALNGKYVKTSIELQEFPTRNKKDQWVLKGKVIEIEHSGRIIPVGTGIYVQTDSLYESLQAGDILQASVRIRSVSDTATGFSQYLYGVGIAFTARQGVWRKIGNSNSLNGLALQLSAWCRNQLIRAIDDEQTAGLTIALITGDRAGLGKDLSNQHKRLGTTHILSVSGLHVGLICLVLLKILSWLDHLGMQGRRFRIIVIMLALIVYALMTGLAPSVCRAVLMTLVSLVGQLFNRKAEGSNVLAFACIVELSWEPCWLFYPGFQLSFAALAGLIWIQPLVLSLWEPENTWLYRTWEMASTAIAAQWSTLPFLIPLAVDFPIYFLPANLLIVPIASLLTGATFTLILLSPVPFVSDCIAWGIHWIAWVMNRITEGLNALPIVSIQLPWNSSLDAWIIGSLLFGLVLFWKWRKSIHED